MTKLNALAATLLSAALFMPALYAESPQPTRSVESLTYKTVKVRVSAIDHEKRLISFRNEQNMEETFLVDDMVRNLDQVEVGDVMVIRTADRLAVRLYEVKTASMGRVEKTEVSRAALGQKPHGSITKTIQLTGRVAQLDAADRTVTVEGKRGSITVAIDDAVSLEGIEVGDMVTAEYLESVAITVQGPAEQAAE